VSAAEVARKAADLLERDGWCQRMAHGPNGARCIAGALLAVRRRRLPAIVGEALLCHTPDSTLAAYNDAPERTGDEVIALLRQVATELEAS
jgi:hypothetical protein